MALRYGFFDSEITGYNDEGMPEFDRAESSDFLAAFISCIITSGVLAVPGNCFQVLAGDSLTLQVQPGFAVIEGRFAYNDETFPITLSVADALNRRIDRVILRANYPERLCEIIVRTGTPAANPSPPELLRTSGDYFELCLAEVSVRAGQTSAAQSDIVDTRADTSVCGWITQAIQQVDTSTLFLQWQDAYQRFYDTSDAEFTAWFDRIKDQLGDNVAGGLLAEIEQKTDKTVTEYLNIQMLDMQIKKAEKSQVVQTIISAQEWQGEAVPYTNTLTVPGVKADSIVELSVPDTAATDQVKAWMNAQLMDGGQSEGRITIRSFGRTPDIDIPVTVIVRGDV